MGMRFRLEIGNGAILRIGGWVTGAIATSVLCLATTSVSVSANQRVFCTGSMNNGWRYSAEARNSDFTQIVWRRSGQEPVVSPLTYSSTNSQGEFVYTGAFRANTLITLIDRSRGNVRTGSRISVTVEEWGSSTGTCGGPIPGAW